MNCLLLTACLLASSTGRTLPVGARTRGHPLVQLRLRGGAKVAASVEAPEPAVVVLSTVDTKTTAARERAAMTAAVIGIVGAWLAAATLYYSARENWPYAQAFFYAVDTGMSIGFGTVAEQRVSTKAFTILHVLLGASAVGGAIALFAEAAVSGAASIAGSEYARASVRAAFRRADTDDSGSLSLKEFEAVLTEWSVPSAELADAIALFDGDNSGSIEIDEFLKLVEPHVDSETKVADAVKLVLKTKATPPVVRALGQLSDTLVSHRVIVLWFVWIFGGALWGVLSQGWDVISATYFAVGALATGGLEGPALNAAGTIPDASAIFVGVYCLTGIPIFAMALGGFANVLIERHISAREKRALCKPITEDEFEFASQLVVNDGKIDLAEFVVLELYRLGKLDPSTLLDIRAEFSRLDKNRDGTIKKEEVLAIAKELAQAKS